MIHLNKIATVFCGLGLGLLALTGCEGADTYGMDSPDWINAKIDSINAAKNAGNEEWTDLNEDVYTIGNTDFTSGWWQSFSKYYQVPEGKVWHAVFNLSVNPNDNTYYKNFGLAITSDADRNADGYHEYGVTRYDFTNDSTKYNSLWGDYLWFKYSSSDQAMDPVDNKDAGLQKLGGQVKLSVDRTSPDTFKIKITNGTVTKTIIEPIHLPNLNSDPSNTNIRCFLSVEGSYIDFQSSNIEPIGGYTSAEDKNPVSMELHNVPDEVTVGDSLSHAMENVSATVTFEEGVTKEVPAADLMFVSVPDMDKAGQKTLVVIYNKTFKGENASTPITAKANFEVVQNIASINVTTNPTNRKYYFYTSAATSGMTDRTLAFDPTGMVVTATCDDGSTRVVKNSKLTFSSVPAEVGSHEVTITTENGKKATVRVNVAESAVSFSTPSPTVLGLEDNTSDWWGAHLDKDINVPSGETREFSFTNYAGSNNYNNYVVVLRNAAKGEYGVLRADNFGWGNGYGTARLSGGQADDAAWATWLAAMNGAKVNVFVTNVGNGTADVQAVIQGNDGKTYTQYYLGVSTVDPSDLYVDFTVDHNHLVFSSTPLFAKKHYATRAHRAHRR